MDIDLKKLTTKQKVAFFVLLPSAILMFIIGIVRGDPDDKPSPPKTEQSAISNAKSAKKNVEKSDTGEKGEKKSSKSKTDASSLALAFNNVDIGTVNPFIEISQLVKAKKEADKTNAPNGSTTPAPVPVITRNRTSSTQSVPLPSIPARNGNTSNNRNVPNRPQDLNARQAKPVTVQGVLTGEDGKNMAIMSDGKVVSEGDVYGDGRIAFIGGDGIQFDNGKTMEYK
ncbi:MAG: hypothetical protein IKN12_11260 [Selenomonadaceae bacterium]|nr:hypothetical protein [Selenomonadaceae bacterium]MBR3723320.1 hypothetical protein [Selenomonadaceae bacterium]